MCFLPSSPIKSALKLSHLQGTLYNVATHQAEYAKTTEDKKNLRDSQ